MDTTTEEPTIAKLVPDLPRLRVFDEELTKYETNYPPIQSIKMVDKNTYLGVEVEIENVRTWLGVSPYWTMTEDGSLRNSGREFITPPIKAWRLEHALETLYNKEINSDTEFSERCSIHVHMNIRTLTVNQLEALIVTYMVFEKVLYEWVGQNRYQNVFCVPLCETTLGSKLHGLIFSKNPMVHGWQKYTGLNLLPITEKGTIEFRQMYGTKDIQETLMWVNMLLSLKIFALRQTPEYIWEKISSLNTTSQYRMFGEEVFGELIHTLYTDTYNNNVANCISYVKRCCFQNNFQLLLKIHPESPLFKKITSNVKKNTLFSSTSLEDIPEEEEARITPNPSRWEPAFRMPPAINIEEILDRMNARGQQLQETQPARPQPQPSNTSLNGLEGTNTPVRPIRVTPRPRNPAERNF